MTRFFGKKIAILGATGHIAKSLIYNFCHMGQDQLFLFARSLRSLNEFLSSLNCRHYSSQPFSEFGTEDYDIIINCVGIGDPAKLQGSGVSIFKVTEQFDNIVLKYLETYSKTLYINFSSGAAYGTEFAKPVNDLNQVAIGINNLSPCDFYGIAKIHSEAKHRSLSNLNIVDLRIFGYFSQFIEPNAGYLMSQLISCVKRGTIFETGSENIIRDYVDPQDLFTIINRCADKRYINDVFDVYSREPVAKFDILEFFVKEHGLKYKIIDAFSQLNATGSKLHYYSLNKRAELIGYVPLHSSLECIIRESDKILNSSL